MRAYTLGDITITYPDQFCLSSDRNIVSIEGATANTKFSLFGDERELIAGAGEFDLRPYFADLFVSEAKNAKFSFKSVTENLLLDGVNFKALDFTQIYYAASRINMTRKLVQTGEFTAVSKWFEFWLPTDMEARINGADIEFVQGFNLVDLSAYSSDVQIIFAVDGFTTFDDTFDYTFTGETVSINITYIDCQENGVQLRWLDVWGLWQQKSFYILGQNKQADASVYNWNAKDSAISYAGLRFAEKTKTDSIDLQTEYCQYIEQSRVSEIVQSQFVHMYDNATAQWLPVVVSTSEIKLQPNKGAQPININILLQNEY